MHIRSTHTPFSTTPVGHQKPSAAVKAEHTYKRQLSTHHTIAPKSTKELPAIPKKHGRPSFSVRGSLSLERREVMVPMVVVLSPAKTMDMTAVKPGQFLLSEPRMMSQASILKSPLYYFISIIC
jgi:hypothetical protein